MILLHGYGSAPDDLVPLAETLAARVRATFVVPASPDAFHGTPSSEGGRGRVWFDQHDADATQQIRHAVRASTA